MAADHGIIGSVDLNGSGENYPFALVRIVEYTKSSADLHGVDSDRYQIKVCIWSSETNYNNGKGPVEEPPVIVAEGAQFDTYLAQTVIDDAGNTDQTQCYEFLKNQTDGRFNGFTDV